MAFIHKFTRGEWKATNNGSYWDVSPENEDESVICNFSVFKNTVNKKGQFESTDPKDSESTSNAKLISQAPALLELAEMLYDDWRSKDKDPVLLKQIRQTIINAGVEITH